MNETIIVALATGVISAGVSILGIVMANRKSSAILEYKVDALDKHVKEHNNLINRMYCCEKAIELQDQRIKNIEEDT